MKLQTIHPEVLFFFVVSLGEAVCVFWKLGEWELERLSSVNNKSQEHQGKSELQKVHMV